MIFVSRYTLVFNKYVVLIILDSKTSSKHHGSIFNLTLHLFYFILIIALLIIRSPFAVIFLCFVSIRMI